MFRILGAERYKGMTRISFIAGRRLLRENRLLRQNAGIVSRALSVPLGETGKGVLELLEKAAQAEKRLKDLEEKSVRAKAEALLRKVEKSAGQNSPGTGPAFVIESYADAGIDEVLRIGRAAQKQTHAALVLVSEQDLKFTALCPNKDFDLRLLLKDAFEANGGRGGGGPSFFQGSFETKKALNAFLGAIQSF